MWRSLLLLAFLCACMSVVRCSIWDDIFHPELNHGPRFTGSALFDVSIGLGHIKGHVGAFGDFNSDKYTDVIIVDASLRNASVFLWDHDEWTFLSEPFASFTAPHISNVAPGDYDYDGNLDALVTGTNEDGTTFVRIYYGTTQAFQPGWTEVVSNATDQLVVFDYNGDLMPDFLGSPAAAPNQRMVWQSAGPKQYVEVAFEPSLSQGLATPAGSAFTDMNGDCFADLVIIGKGPSGSGKQLEIWLHVPDSGAWLPPGARVYALPPGTGQVTIADFNKDGAHDLVFPVCYPRPNCSSVNEIVIMYNVQGGRTPSKLCRADNSFYFDQPNNTASQYIVRVPREAFGSSYFQDASSRTPLVLRAGDYNLDGYPDVLVPVLTSDGYHQVQLWQNVVCQPGLCNTPAQNAGLRTFAKVLEGVGPLSQPTHAWAGTFMDFDEDGILDILLLTDPKLSDKGEHDFVRGIYNNFYNDAFFLKTLGLNGRCLAWCSDGPKFPDPKPYGVNYAGGTFKFVVTSLGGKKFVQQGSPLSQSTHLALQTPYILFGLGRTSNYIEYFFYGISKASSSWYNSWIALMPNSQLIAAPYPPSKPLSWSLELYLNPGSYILWVIVALLSSVLVIGGTIALLTWKERREDKKEKSAQAQFFSFDAL